MGEGGDECEMIMEVLPSISGDVLYKLSTVRANVDFFIMSANYPIVVLCCVYTVVLFCIQAVPEYFRLGKVRGPGGHQQRGHHPRGGWEAGGAREEQPNMRVWWRTGRLH